MLLNGYSEWMNKTPSFIFIFLPSALRYKSIQKLSHSSAPPDLAGSEDKRWANGLLRADSTLACEAGRQAGKIVHGPDRRRRRFAPA